VNVTCSIDGDVSGPLDSQRVTELLGWAETMEALTTFTTPGEIVSLNCTNTSTVATVTIDNSWLVGVQIDNLVSTMPMTTTP
jgi:hypothetical protein